MIKIAPKEIPKELINCYSMDNKIPIYSWYINETESSTINWNNIINDYI